MKKLDKNSKEKLNEMFDLIKRMEEGKSKTSKILIQEAIKNSKRVQVTRDQILDVLDKQDKFNSGQFASFSYVTPIELYKTKKNWRQNDVSAALEKHNSLNDKEWYKNLNDYNQETAKGKNPIQYAVAVHKYLVHWTSPDNYNKKYAEYSDKLHNLRMRHGVGIESDGMLGDNRNQRTTTTGGERISQAGNLQRDFNMIGSKCTTTWYLLNDNGNIIDVLPEEIVNAMIAPKSYNEFSHVEAEVRKALQGNEEALQQYANEKREIDKIFKGRTFLMDKILSIVATSDGVQYYWINDAISSKIRKGSDVSINTTDFINIAQNELKQQFSDISSEKFSK